jgi:hypothetical protein
MSAIGDFHFLCCGFPGALARRLKRHVEYAGARRDPDGYAPAPWPFDSACRSSETAARKGATCPECFTASEGRIPAEPGPACQPVIKKGGGDVLAPAIKHWFASKRRRSTGRRTAAGDQAFALHALAGQLAYAANGLGLFAGALLRRLLVVVAHLHFAEDAFTLHLLLERPEGLIDVVIADEYLHVYPIPCLGCLPAASAANKTRSFGMEPID